jgi:hypothetical protein
MSLNNAPILVMCWDAPTAHALVKVISAARGDVVYAANTGEAMQRLQQFSFNAAVLCWQTGADTVAAALQVNGVPFFMFGLPASGTAAIANALVVTDMDQVVPVLGTLLMS